MIDVVELKNQNKSWIILGINFLILGLIFLTISYNVNSDEWYFHEIFIFLSSLIVFNKFIKLRSLPKQILFFDLRWIFLFSFWFYFVLGPSLLVFGDKELIDNTKDIYPVELELALRINSIHAIGLSVVLIMYSKFKLTWPMNIINKLKKEIKFCDPMGHRTLIVATSFCLFSLVNILLVRTQYIDKSFLHGIYQIFQHAGVGFSLVLFYYQGKFRKIVCLIILLYLSTYMWSGFYFLDKSAIMAPLTFLLVSYCIKTNSFKLLILIFVGLFFLIQILGSFVTYKRSYETNFKFSETINPTKSMYTFKLWDRINYTSSQAAALDLFSEDNGGESLSNIIWLFVPRFLNKDKPDVSSSSRKFSKKFRKHGGTRDSPGVFVEGYYNYGWIGLILVSFLIGLVLKIYSVLIKSIINKKIYSFYFIIFSGIWTSFRIDGLIITDYLGQLIIFLYFIILIILILILLRSMTVSTNFNFKQK